MIIPTDNGKLSSYWYRTPSDTCTKGLWLKFYTSNL